MAMTPEEYAAKELNVPGWDHAEPLYAPGYNPSEQAFDPNILTVMNGGPPPEPEPTPVDPIDEALVREFHVELPVAIRRAELASEIAKGQHLSARANFWNVLSGLLTPRVK
jgi:hypothetical protein